MIISQTIFLYLLSLFTHIVWQEVNILVLIITLVALERESLL